MVLRGLILDFHGTLATRRGPPVEALLERLQSLGYGVYNQALDATWRFVNFVEHPHMNFTSWEAVMARVMHHLGVQVNPEDLPPVAELMAREEWTLLGDSIPCLKLLQGSYRMVIVTSIMAFRIGEAVEPLKPYLSGRGLITSPDAGVCKPHPGIYRRGLAELGLPAREVATVGDEPDVDLPVPRALGITPIHLDRAGTGEVLDVPTIGHLGELPGMLETLGRP